MDVTTKPMFAGKKLLVLGSNVGSDEIVRYARSNGAYTFVADYLPTEQSAAKQLADEAVLLSTGDLAGLEGLIWEKEIDGVLAGISEFNLRNAMLLAERCDLPFYCTQAQWELVENKEQFRRLCMQHHVPCPQVYVSGTALPEHIQANYPVVIKPVDGSGSAGVHICRNEQEVRQWEEDALKHSGCGRIIAEQFVRGEEFTAHYTICNGVCTLSCVDKRYPAALHDGNVTTIPIARVYPSMFLREYTQRVDGAMRSLIDSLRLENAVVFVQGMYHPVDGFAIFEAGLRCAGEAVYRFLEPVNCVNCMHLLVEHVLLGYSVSFYSHLEDVELHGKFCGVVSFAAKGGIVGSIVGLEETVSALPQIVAWENRYPMGAQTPVGDSLRQIMLRFVIVADSMAQLSQVTEVLNKNIHVYDSHGNPMVVKPNPEIFK